MTGAIDRMVSFFWGGKERCDVFDAIADGAPLDTKVTHGPDGLLKRNSSINNYLDGLVTSTERGNRSSLEMLMNIALTERGAGNYARDALVALMSKPDLGNYALARDIRSCAQEAIGCVSGKSGYVSNESSEFFKLLLMAGSMLHDETSDNNINRLIKDGIKKFSVRDLDVPPPTPLPPPPLSMNSEVLPFSEGSAAQVALRSLPDLPDPEDLLSRPRWWINNSPQNGVFSFDQLQNIANDLVNEDHQAMAAVDSDASNADRNAQDAARRDILLKQFQHRLDP